MSHVLTVTVFVPCLSPAACKGNVAIDTMWNKLKCENQQKASHLEQRCLSLRVSSVMHEKGREAMNG